MHYSNQPSPPVVIETNPDVSHAVIWLHGLGASGDDFVSILPALSLPESLGVRFIFPHAPVMPVTFNGGMQMPAWYDIYSLDRNGPQDEQGILAAEQLVQGLIKQQLDQGIPAKNIVLIGFSQGAAMALFTGARYEQPLAGVIGLSGYLPLAQEVSQAVAQAKTPFFMAHGEADQVVPLSFGETSLAYLQQLGYCVSWHTYEMGHEVIMPEINDISSWIQQVCV